LGKKLQAKSRKKSIKHRLALIEICLAKEMQHIILYSRVNACNLSYTDEEWKALQVDSETVCPWLVDHINDRAKKALCI